MVEIFALIRGAQAPRPYGQFHSCPILLSCRIALELEQKLPFFKGITARKAKMFGMIDKGKTFNTIIDFITGKETPEIGSEANRQKVERLLVGDKGFAKRDIEVDADIEIVIGGEVYRSQIDLVAMVEEKRFMVIKCVAASLGSWEREILSAARLLDRYQIPLAVVSDGKTAIVLDTLGGKKVGEGLKAIPSKDEAKKVLATLTLSPLPEKRREQEKIIFRSYDSMNVNVRRNL